jgi:hypothetical protein
MNAMKTELSPAAQAVHDAAFSELPDGLCLKAALAAALRAAADQVVPSQPIIDPTWVGDAYKQRQDTRAYLLAIATELEIQP